MLNALLKLYLKSFEEEEEDKAAATAAARSLLDNV